MFVDDALQETPVAKNAIARRDEACLRKSRLPLIYIDFDEVSYYDCVMAEECEKIYGVLLKFFRRRRREHQRI